MSRSNAKKSSAASPLFPSLASLSPTDTESEFQIPWVADNGLRVKKRSFHSISLCWSGETESNASVAGYQMSSPQERRSPAAAAAAADSASRGVISMDDDELELPVTPVGGQAPRISANDDVSASAMQESSSSALAGPWFEVQMKGASSDDANWESIYRGYATKYEVKNLRPDTSLSFRLRTHGDKGWGSTIVAATNVCPPTAEELQRAVACNAFDMVLRIIGTCRPNHLKAILSVVDRNGLNALMLCAANSNPEMMTVLINCGAELNYASMTSGKTALMIACGKGDLECVHMLTIKGADWGVKDKAGMSAIHYVVTSGSVNVLHYALKVCPKSANEKDGAGWTPLLRAAAIASSEAVVCTLLHAGADPNAVDKLKSKSCLMVAASKTNPAVVEALLEYNADPSYQNCNGTTALDMAKGFGVQETVLILEKALRDWGHPAEVPASSRHIGHSLIPNLLQDDETRQSDSVEAPSPVLLEPTAARTPAEVRNLMLARSKSRQERGRRIRAAAGIPEPTDHK